MARRFYSKAKLDHTLQNLDWVAIISKSHEFGHWKHDKKFEPWEQKWFPLTILVDCPGTMSWGDITYHVETEREAAERRLTALYRRLEEERNDRHDAENPRGHASATKGFD
ncbi:MAG: hypothetical protein GY700_06565 [Propionibacteriaceae bacterium]|nr:hypothetical protein [Propionibacteriaceae bacterium]